MHPSTVLGQWEWLTEQFTYPPEPDPAVVAEWNMVTEWLSDAPGIRGDTYPCTWADDDQFYASAGDPQWGRIHKDGLDLERFDGTPPDYRIVKVNEMAGLTGWGGKGAKPSGLICVKGVLYLAAQNLMGFKPPVYGEKSQHGSDAGIFRSDDHGLTWTPEPTTPCPQAVMFPGPTFGGPAFVNFGKDNANARDGFVYAVSNDQWDNGTHLRVGRVPADRIMDAAAWEFVSSLSADHTPAWSRDLASAAPVFSDPRRLSIPEMVYVAGFNRYLLLTWRLFEDFDGKGSELFVYDAPEPWGPFTLVHHEPVWETVPMTPYCPRIPLKWARMVDENTLEAWLLFSGSWIQYSPHYRAHVRKFRLRRLAR